MGEPERRFLAEETQAIAQHNLIHRIVQRVLCAPGKGPASGQARVSNRTSEARREAEEIGEYKLINPVPLSTEPQSMFSQHQATVVLGLVIVLVSLLGSQQVWSDVPQGKTDSDQYRCAIGVQRIGCVGQAVGINDAVIEIHIAETYLMVPAPSRIIQTGNVGISVVQVGKGTQIPATKTGHTIIEVVIETIEGSGLAGDVPIQPGSSDPLIKRSLKASAELRDGSGDDRIGVVALILRFPEQVIFDKWTAQAEADNLTIKIRFGCGWISLIKPLVGGNCRTAILEERRAVDVVGATAGDNVHGTRGSKIGARIQRGLADTELLD